MDKLKHAGDVTIREVTIISSNGMGLDVIPQLVSLELYESLYDPFISGKLVLNDAQALRDFFPMVGNEMVRLSFEAPTIGKDFAYEGDFFLYDSGDTSRISERSSVYVLNFISKEAVIDRNKRISKTLKGNPTDMITYLLGDNGLQTEKAVFM